MIIIFVADDFQHKSNSEQNAIRNALQRCATSAGLAGAVALVWNTGGGRMGFLAPDGWHPFFRSISLAHVAGSINRELTCG